MSTYTNEYLRKEGFTTYALVVGDGEGKRRKNISKKEKTKFGYLREVELHEGDVIVAVRNRWEMLKESVEILMYGVTKTDGDDFETVLFDKFNGKHWENKKHNHYRNLIDDCIESVGRYSMFEKKTV